MADFETRPHSSIVTHDAVVVAAGASSAKTIQYRNSVKALSVYWKKTAGLGTFRLRLFAVTKYGDEQIGADQTATSGRLDLPAGAAVFQVKVELAETGALNSITATVEVAAAD